MGYTGSGVGKGIGDFGAIFAQLFGNMQGRRDQQADLSRRAAIEQDRIAAQERRDSDLASYRDETLQFQRDEAERAEADRVRQGNIDAMERERRREVDDFTLARQGGVRGEDTPGAIIPTGGFRGAFAAMLPKRGELSYDPEADVARQQRAEEDERRHNYNMAEIGARGAITLADKDDDDPPGDAVLRRQLFIQAQEQLAKLAERAQIAQLSGTPFDAAAEELKIIEPLGYTDMTSFQRGMAELAGIPQAPQPSTAGKSFQKPSAPAPGEGSPPQSGQPMAPDQLAEIASMGVPPGVPDEVWNMALIQLSQGVSPVQLVNEARAAGAPRSDLLALQRSLGIGR